MQKKARQSNQSLSHKDRKISGIAPVFDQSYPLDGFKIINAKSAGFSGSTPFVQPVIEKKRLLGAQDPVSFVSDFLHNWVFQEFWFVMNKLSIFGLMMGMMFLGMIFFGVGFLTAYKTLPSESSEGKGAWHHANKNAGMSQFASVAGNVAGNYVEDAAMGAAGKAMNVVGKATSKLPPALQPFSNYASAKISKKLVGEAGHSTELARENSKKLMSGQGMTGNPYNTSPAVQAPDQMSGQFQSSQIGQFQGQQPVGGGYGMPPSQGYAVPSQPQSFQSQGYYNPQVPQQNYGQMQPQMGQPYVSPPAPPYYGAQQPYPQQVPPQPYYGPQQAYSPPPYTPSQGSYYPQPNY